ncbi:MAG: FecR domain-containing protein [Chitinophagaceae bacterium]|nr:FecR domain-containing protein [Chitinophagaceae bacterium]
MNNERLKYLLEQYTADASTPEETKELFKWIRNLNDDTLLKEKIRELWSGDEQMPGTGLSSIHIKSFDPPLIGKRRIWLRVVAAIVIVTLGVGSYFLFNPHNEQPVAGAVIYPVKAELAPGGDKAVLTLANGQQIVLDSTGEGTLTQQGNTKIIKLDHGQLTYSSPDDKPGKVLYNTISTPRGGQYQIVLSDGSKVWLNAASSLHFPVSFTGEKREVTLSGEGYFEVVHNENQPFVVLVKGIEVQVLGTHFNVNAYNDEGAIKTTLLEGLVRINNGKSGKVINPGQQAQIKIHDNSLNPEIIVQTVDVDAVTAWKNGRFIFKGDDIQAVMRQLARWYDADVSYEENITREQFVGVINRSRYDSISDVLEMLEKTGTVSFAVQGNYIKVMPYQK